MNILLIGSGGREHAIANALARSPRLRQLFVAPGNPGIARRGELVDLDVADHRAVVEFCRQNGVGLVVVGPEQPLIAGIADDLARARHSRLRANPGGGAAGRLQGLHQGSVPRPPHSDRRLWPLRQ